MHEDYTKKAQTDKEILRTLKVKDPTKKLLYGKVYCSTNTEQYGYDYELIYGGHIESNKSGLSVIFHRLTFAPYHPVLSPNLEDEIKISVESLQTVRQNLRDVGISPILISSISATLKDLALLHQQGIPVSENLSKLILPSDKEEFKEKETLGLELNK